MAAPGGIATGLGLWLRADVGTSTTTNGTSVATWTDQSTNAYAIAAIGAGGGLYRPTSLNGRPSLEFSGTVGYTSTNATLMAMLNAVGGCSMFAVASESATATTHTIFATAGGTSQSLSRASSTSSTGSAATGGRRLDADSFASVVGTSIGTTPHVLSWMYDWTNALASNYINGVVSGGPSAWLTAGSTSATNSLGAGVGISQDGANLGWVGQISEIAVYNRLVTAAERRAIETDLMMRWGFSPRPIPRQSPAALIRASVI